MEDFQERVKLALTRIIWDKNNSYNRFLCEFIGYLKWHEDPNCPTAGVCVDSSHIHIQYNKDWMMALDDDSFKFVILHELNHVVMGHVFSPLYYHTVGNIAADLEINQSPYCASIPEQLNSKEEGDICIQTPELYNFEPNKTREEYYNLLMDKVDAQCAKCMEERAAGGEGNQKDGENGGQGTGKCGRKLGKEGHPCKGKSFDDHSKWHGENAEDKKQIWKNRIEAAIEQSNAKGFISGDAIERIMTSWRRSPTLQRLLKRLVGKQISASALDQSYWRKRNKRFKLYPGNRSVYGPRFVVAVDTSGSMGSKELAHVYSIIKWLNKSGYDGKVIQCDSAISHVTDISRVRAGEIKIYGRGGTSSVPVFNWIEKNRYQPDLLIFFSDMETDFPSQSPEYKVAWVNTVKDSSAGQPPFGIMYPIDI